MVDVAAGTVGWWLILYCGLLQIMVVVSVIYGRLFSSFLTAIVTDTMFSLNFSFLCYRWVGRIVLLTAFLLIFTLSFVSHGQFETLGTFSLYFSSVSKRTVDLDTVDDFPASVR